MAKAPPDLQKKVMNTLDKNAPVEVSLTLGLTINLGNYESERIDMTIAGTLAPGKQPNSFYKEADRYLSDKLAKARDQILGVK